MKDDILIDVSRETIVLLQRLGLLVEKWNKSINLISKSTIPEIWSRHVLDSAQIFYASNKKFKKWLDMGSLHTAFHEEGGAQEEGDAGYKMGAIINR